MSEMDFKAFHAGIAAIVKELKRLNETAGEINSLQLRILAALQYDKEEVPGNLPNWLGKK